MNFLTLIAIFSILWLITTALSYSRARKHPSLPPGPFHLPIIGNILDLGPKPHRSLAELSRKFGPIFSLKLGSITTVVLSSPETAKTILQKHDAAFSDRCVPTAITALRHDEFSLAWLPAGSHWRKLRRICREHVFSAARLDASQDLRTEKLQQLCEYVTECGESGRAVDIGAAAFTTTLNLMSATVFSTDFAGFGSDSSKEMEDVVWGVFEAVGGLNLADYFPVLKPVDPQGMFEKTKVCFEKLFAVFDRIIDEKLKSREGKKHDLVEALIDIYRRDEAEFSRNDINHLLLDLFVAGTETTARTVEWAMAELLKNPEKLSTLTIEIRGIIEKNGEVQESDIQHLPYLQAVVKEALRLHPTLPLLAPHKAESDVEINGYLVPKNAQVLINGWAIGRDSNVWKSADLFMPERFLDGDDRVDFKGKDFELIPFGAGRRICPGLPLAYRMVHVMVATLLGKFRWNLEGIEAEDLDMDDKFGLALVKAIPLKAVPTSW